MKKGVLVVVSGFSGAGKGTIMKKLVAENEGYALSISATTRQPREGEEHGREYFFKTVAEFEEMIANEQLLEYAKYVENYYGTPRTYVEEQLASGKNVLLEIEIQGALKIKEKFPEAKLIFITAPDAKTLVERLTGRGTEDAETIKKRLMRATQEAEGIEAYDYIVVNDKLEECTETIDRIIKMGDNIGCGNISIINTIKEELKTLMEGE